MCDIDSTYGMTDNDGLTAAASCGVVGPKNRRRIITIRIATLRCRPHINLIVGDGGERNPASEIPVLPRIFQTTGSPNLTTRIHAHRQSVIIVHGAVHTEYEIVLIRYRFKSQIISAVQRNRRVNLVTDIHQCFVETVKYSLRCISWICLVRL